MDLSKLTYSKEDSARTPADVPLHKATTENKDESGMSETIQVPLAYRKTEGILSTSLIFVLSGGEKRERDFLLELIRQRELHSLKVAFMSEKGQGLQPYQMQDKWGANPTDRRNKNRIPTFSFGGYGQSISPFRCR